MIGLASSTQADIVAGIVVVLLIVFASIVSLSYAAIAQTSKTKARALAEDGRRNTARLLAITEEPERYLNGVRLAALTAQTVQAVLVGVISARQFGGVGLIVTILLDILVVFVFVEAAPRTWAVEHPERAAVFGAPVVALVGWIPPLRWAARALIGVANVILPGKGLRRGPWITEGEILAIADVAVEEEVIHDDERNLIESIIEFGDTVARELMVPRTDMVAFGEDFRVGDSVEIAILNGLSRFPVFSENLDDITGIVYAKDLMAADRDDRSNETVAPLCRDAMFIPETKMVSQLLRDMQANKTHIAIVVDEYGGTAGLVTMEDLLEELVGEIADEFDPEEISVDTMPSGDLVVSDASLNVDDLNGDYDLELPEGDWDSIGGLIMAELGRLPDEGDHVDVDGYRLRVETVDGRRIGAVRISATEYTPHDLDGKLDRSNG